MKVDCKENAMFLEELNKSNFSYENRIFEYISIKKGSLTSIVGTFLHLK